MKLERQHEAQQLNAFVDGELELAAALELEARCAHDAALRAEVDALRQLRAAVRECASYHAAPVALRARLAEPAALGAAQAIAPPARSRTAEVRGWLQRWFAWRPMVPALGVAALLAWGLNLVPLAGGGDERIAQQVIASQVRSSLGQHLVDVASSDQHTVKPWLSARLDYSPPVHELALPGVAFLGGRIDYVDGRPVAALVYRDGKHLVNAFVWPSGERAGPVRTTTERGFHVAHWAAGGMTTWVVSDMNPGAFETFVHAFADAAR